MSLFQLPIIGPWAYKTSHIIDIVSTPCAPTPMIQVKAFWHAAPYLVWSLVKPDWTDFLTNRFGTHHKRNRKWRLNTVDWHAADFPIRNALGWAAFSGIRLVERVGWYLLVVDASLDFGVHWTSAMWQWSGCRVPGAPYYRGHHTPGVYGPIDAGTYDVNFWQMDQQHVFQGDSDGVETPAGYWSSAGASLITSKVPDFLPQAALGGFQIVDVNSGEASEPGLFNPNYDGQFTATAAMKNWDQLQPARNYHVRFEKSYGFWKSDGGHLIASGIKERPIERDP